MRTPIHISWLAILASILLFLPQSAAASPASSSPATQSAAAASPQTSALSAKLDEYLAHIDCLEIPAACAEVDFLISSVQDEALRNTVAQRAYFHFRESKIMGSENIAIHIYDRWFADYTAIFDDLDKFEEAGLHAYVNRASLIGAQAPSLTLTSPEGDEITLPKPGRKAVIFFYSATCPKCLLTSIGLCSFLTGKKSSDPLKTTRIRAGKMDFFAIYAGDDDAQWAEYTRKHLNLKSSCKSKLYHLKAEGSDFVPAYGVVQTPRLFLVGEDGRVIGRNLDVPALEKLMKITSAAKKK